MAKKISLKDLKNLPPEERIAVLKKFEDQRKKEIEQAESLLKNSEVEVQKKRETERENEQKGKELLEKKISSKSNEEALEEIVEESQKPADGNARPVYGAPLEEMRRVYEMATREVYEGVKELRNRASRGMITEDEVEKINFYESQLSSVATVNEAYINDKKAKENFVKIKTALEQIKEYKGW
jgi:hypothetical protein